MRAYLLGTLAVEVDGQPVDLGPPKQRAVFAILALRPGQIVSSDRLIDMIWGEEAPRTAAHSIQIYVSNLRKTLGRAESEILTQAPGYVLTIDPDDVDAFRFQRLVESGGPDQLRAALDMWQGEPLVEFAYEAWAQPHIRRLKALWGRAVELLAEADLDGGRASDAVETLSDLIDWDPLREQPRRLIMLALYRSGRQAEALRVYREYRELLADELGVEPSQDLAELEEQILLRDTALTPPSPAATGVVRSVRNPYKGLQPFDEMDAADFHGRAKLVSQMIDILSAGARLLVVVGPSGSGKSSAVRAGLIPALRAGGVAGSARWPVAIMTPEARPFDSLAASLSRASLSSEPDNYLALLSGSDAGLLRASSEILEEGSELLLVIDQFEELFTMVSERVRRRFLEAIVTAVSDDRSQVRVVVTLRADFYDRPLLARRFAPVFAANVVSVVPMTAPELETAIVAPAASAGLEVDPRLVTQLVADMGDEAAALPLLQFALMQTVDNRSDRTMTLEAYQGLGGLHGALSVEIEKWYGSLSAGEQEDVKRVLLRLVRLERGSEPIRRRVALSELRMSGEVDDIISALVERRLLTADRDPVTGTASVQVTHEALLTGWTRLKDWIDLHSTDLERQGVLTNAASEWAAAERDPDFLMGGGRLTAMERWASETDVHLDQLAEEYLQESLARWQALEAEEEERRERERLLATRAKRRLWGMAATAVLAVGALTYTVLAFIPEPIPPVAYVSTGRDGFLGEMLMDGFDQAATDLGDDVLAHHSTDLFSAETALESVSNSGAEYVLANLDFQPAVAAVAASHPDVKYAVLDAVGDPLPNTLYVYFESYEAAFLVGAAAALKSDSGIIGFVGAVDIPPINIFRAGFEAGARQVRPNIEVAAIYLVPPWEHSGFESETLAQLLTEPLYESGADVVFHAAAHAGFGVFEAAVVESERQGRHLWAIGVDTDQYFTNLEWSHFEPDGSGGPDPRRWQPHILTSAVKNYDLVTRDLLLALGRGEFEPGLRGLGLAEGAVGYSTSGGHIDDIVPIIEDLKQKIISGEIVVPFTLAN